MKYWIIGLAAVFSLDFFLRLGIPIERAREAALPSTAEITSLERVAKTDLSNVAISLWGDVYQEPTEVEETSNSIFEIVTPDSIKTIGNVQFVLYALAELEGKVHAYLWMQELDKEQDNISLNTVTLGSEINSLKVKELSMKDVTISDGNSEIKLEIFKRASDE